jgi:hypothetical protein
MKGGGNPGGTLPTNEPIGKGGVLVAAGTAGTAGSMPAARNFSSKELGSGTGVEDEAGGAREL